MKFSTFLAIILSSLVGVCISRGRQFQNYQNNQANINQNQGGLQGVLNRQVAGISFAIPGLSLLGGNNGGVGGNFFGPVTVTRTVVSTVSTVTAQAFRTCTTTAMNLMPCGAGRRKRDTEPESSGMPERIFATPSIKLVIGSTTITDQKAVTEYLEAHKPSNQSVIYPPGIDESKLTMNPRFESMSDDQTTILYPSQDTPETTDSSLPLENDEMLSYDDVLATTETPYLLMDDDTDSGTTPNADLDDLEGEKARVGLGRTTTLTTIIRVTSVATALASGTSNTVQITYGGCIPQSYPVSGTPCMT